MENKYFKNLTNEERDIIANKGTEAPFSGEYNDHFEQGYFVCRACNNKLYESKYFFKLTRLLIYPTCSYRTLRTT